MFLSMELPDGTKVVMMIVMMIVMMMTMIVMMVVTLSTPFHTGDTEATECIRRSSSCSRVCKW